MKVHTKVKLCLDVLQNTLLRSTSRGLLSFSDAVFITDTGENTVLRSVSVISLWWSVFLLLNHNQIYRHLLILLV